MGQSKAYFNRRKHIGQQDQRSNKRISSFTAPTASITEVSLVNTPCFSQDSVGNSLSNYIEARLCAAVNGLHFLAPQKMFTNNKRNESTIFAYLPALVQHQHPAKSGKSVDLESTCPCSDACHERRKALLHSRIGNKSNDSMHIYIERFALFGLICPFFISFSVLCVLLDAVRQILDPALSAHHAIMKGRNIPILHNAAAFALPLPYNTSIYEGSRKISVISSFKTPVPIIPDVAIHYRCGDNTVGNYGFLPFAVFSDLLDKGAKTIYIMAENPYRKTQNKKNRKMDDKCAIILRALVKHITVRARESIVVLLRGANVYNDLVRLSYARQTFCSVSTFCFYPALVQRNQVFFPATNLIADGHTFQYHDKFKWLKGDNYSVVFGARIRAASNINSILTLVGGTGNGNTSMN